MITKLLGVPFWVLETDISPDKLTNTAIEEQLKLIDLFWLSRENYNTKWENNEEIQIKYFDYLARNKFINETQVDKIEYVNKITNYLVEIGLLTLNRRLSNAGKHLLNIVTSNEFTSNNFLKISKDSFIYLKQLLKTSYSGEGLTIRPLIILIKLILELNYLTIDEFEILLPLCTTKNSTECILKNIFKLREKKEPFDKFALKSVIGNNTIAIDIFQKTYKSNKNLLIKYFSLTEIFSFDKNVIKLTKLAEAYFKNCIHLLYLEAFSTNALLNQEAKLNKITNFKDYSEDKLLPELSRLLHKNITSIKEAYSLIAFENINKFNTLANGYYENSKLLDVLINIAEGKGEFIEEYLSKGVSLDDILKYFVEIIWYKVNHKIYNIFDLTTVSLTSNLRPRSHINQINKPLILNYSKTECYPKHDVLIYTYVTKSTEETNDKLILAISNFQHYQLQNMNSHNYAIFIANNINKATLRTIREQLYQTFCDPFNTYIKVKGLRIIPLKFTDLFEIYNSNFFYEELFKLFDEASNSTEFDPEFWYNELKNELIRKQI